MAKGDKRKRGRPQKDGPRDRSGRLIRESGKFTPPPQHILELRRLFSFVTASKGPDGRTGEIDQDVCDGIGQLHAVGLFHGHGHDPQEMRDKGREWGHHWFKLMRHRGFKGSSFERQDPGRDKPPVETRFDAMWDQMNANLGEFERNVLLSLIVDPLIGSAPLGDAITPWAQAHIDEQLGMKHKRFRQTGGMIIYPGPHERTLFEACVRGLVQLIDAAVPARWERAA